jgi:hypothetical protein
MRQGRGTKLVSIDGKLWTIINLGSPLIQTFLSYMTKLTQEQRRAYDELKETRAR